MENIVDFFKYLFLFYGLLLAAIYFGFSILATVGIKKNNRRAVFLNVNDIVSATDVPSITLIAPAYNEGKTILMNVKSLLSLQYPYYELIIVNDGSTDDSIDQLISTYDLEEVDSSFITQPIPTATVNRIFKSRKDQYRQLTVIDKSNGGKADANNAGANFSTTELVLFTDADCIIEQDALLKMVRPFLEETEQEVIACGGAIGVLNDSIIDNGVLKKLKLPKNIVPRTQVVEYIRAFLLGRMAWNELNGVMLISGAFGLYSRKRLLEINGFKEDTVGEDFELGIRLRKHMEERKIPYKIAYLPETLCWTEGPDSFNIFIRQRDRWARGLWETLSLHKHMFFNPKYKAMGFIFIPFWVIFEFGAPLFEFFGLILFCVFWSLGYLDISSAILMIGLLYLITCIFSSLAIFMYVINFKHYNNPKDIIRLLIASYLEPFVYHPLLVYAQIKGYVKKIFNIKSGWGIMTRKGFSTSE